MDIDAKESAGLLEIVTGETSSTTRIVKVFNPNVVRMKTYQAETAVISIGSGSRADLRVHKPTLLPEHLVVNFDERKVFAYGPDIIVSGNVLAPGDAVYFSSGTVVRLRGIAMGFYTTVEEAERHSPALQEEASKSLVDEPEDNEGRKKLKVPASEEASPAATAEGCIDERLKKVESDISRALFVESDSGVVKRDVPDLGRSVLEKDVLEQAKAQENAEGGVCSGVKEKIIEDVKDDVKDKVINSVRDSIKSEIREDMNEMVQDEVQAVINGAVADCLNSSVSNIAEQVMTKIEEKEAIAAVEEGSKEEPSVIEKQETEQGSKQEDNGIEQETNGSKHEDNDIGFEQIDKDNNRPQEETDIGTKQVDKSSEQEENDEKAVDKNLGNRKNVAKVIESETPEEEEKTEEVKPIRKGGRKRKEEKQAEVASREPPAEEPRRKRTRRAAADAAMGKLLQ